MTLAKMIARWLIILSAFILIFPVSAQNGNTLTDEETAIIDRVTLALDELTTAQSYRYRVSDLIDIDMSFYLADEAENLRWIESTDISGAYTSRGGSDRIAVRGTYEENTVLSDLLDEGEGAGSIDFEMVVINEDLYLLVTGSDGTIDIPRFVPDGWFLLTQDFPLITELTVRPTGISLTNFDLTSALSIIQRDTIIMDDEQAIVPYTFEFDVSSVPLEELDTIIEGIDGEEIFGDLFDEFIDTLLTNLHIKVSVLLHEESGDLYATSIAISGYVSLETEFDGATIPTDITLNTIQNSWYRDFNDSITIIAPSVGDN